MGYSTEFWKRAIWKCFGFSCVDDFQVGFKEAYFSVMDPNDLLCMARKWQRGDVSRHTNGDLAAALGLITARTFALPISEDMVFPVRDCASEQELIPNGELRVIDSVCGHLGLLGPARVTRLRGPRRGQRSECCRCVLASWSRYGRSLRG